MVTLFNINYPYIEALNIAINEELLQKEYVDYYPSNFIQFLISFSRFNKLAIFILFKTSLRFSDAKKLNIRQVIERESFSIQQTKTKQIISQNFIIYNKNLKKIILEGSNFEQFFNYESLRSEIKRQQLKYFNSQIMNFKSDTHFFRHFNASFYFKKGTTKEFIKNKLGHFDIDSQKSYIHPEL